MGRGIAQVFAYAGYDVTIIDFKERSADGSASLLREAKVEVEENLKLLNLLNVVQENEDAAMAEWRNEYDKVRIVGLSWTDGTRDFEKKLKKSTFFQQIWFYTRLLSGRVSSKFRVTRYLMINSS